VWPADLTDRPNCALKWPTSSHAIAKPSDSGKSTGCEQVNETTNDVCIRDMWVFAKIQILESKTIVIKGILYRRQLCHAYRYFVTRLHAGAVAAHGMNMCMKKGLPTYVLSLSRALLLQPWLEHRMLLGVTVHASIRNRSVAHVFVFLIIQRLGVSIVSLARVLSSIADTHPSMSFTFLIS